VSAQTTLDVALDLYARGFSVIPVPRPDPAAGFDGKVPRLAWTPYQTTRADEAQIRAWFSTPQNLAIVTGAISGIVVVDADSPAACKWMTRHLPWTPWQVRTSRGFHAYYRDPGDPVGNRAKIPCAHGVALDVRGDGGYVIGPGSLHASGHVYTWAGDWTQPIDQVPRFWRGWFPRRPAQPAPAPAGRHVPSRGHVLDRARKYLAAIPIPIIGAGSDVATLSAACRLVRGFDLSPTEAEDLLWQWAGHRPGWDRAWVAAKVRHALRYGSEPIGGLR
jgi:hypothetical protein